MNRRMILYVLGRTLLAGAGLMAPCIAVGLIYREQATAAFIPPTILLLTLGLIAGVRRPENTAIYSRDGFVTVALAWIVLSLIGALPFYLSGEPQFASFLDCIFEIVSGLTTTGATILPNVDAVPKCLLFWRSFSHWIGGMGVLVFVLAVIPLSENRSLYLMRAEVPGPVVGKLVPRMRQTAKILYSVYSVMTVVLIVLLIAGGMPVFDSVCHAFGAAGTGGFSVKTAGIAYYDSAYIEIVLSIFMLLFGVNFNLYYLITIRRVREAVTSEELRWYGVIVGAATLLIAGNVYALYRNAATSLRHALFQVSSIITTTGYGTVDFARDWPQLSQMLLLILMLVGACAGSTGGGLKVSRVILLFKTFAQEVRHLIHPRAISVVRLEGRPVESDTLRNTLAYFVMYIVIVVASVLLLSLDDFDLTTNLSAELACFNNIGPGLGLVGPMDTYRMFSPGSKLLLTVNMLFGRLEIYPMLVLLSPRIWKRNVN